MKLFLYFKRANFYNVKKNQLKKRNVFLSWFKENNIMKNKTILCKLMGVSLFVIMFFTINHSGNAQSMKLVIGQYECTSNSACTEGYCDIDTHKCVANPECKNQECKSCLDLSDCKIGWSVVNNVCKECTSDDECAGDKPRCVSNQCVSCPTNRPVWNGEYCDCPDGEINIDGLCVKCASSSDCPTDKPMCNAISHKCEGCPADKPIWNGKECGCPDGEYYANGKCMKLVECYTNENCLFPKPICNTETGMCERCPETTPDWDGKKCNVKYKVTLHNMDEVTTYEVFRDEEFNPDIPSQWNEFEFSHWAEEKGGAAVSLPKTVTSNKTYYAYYKDRVVTVTPSLVFNAGHTMKPGDFGGLVKWHFEMTGRSANTAYIQTFYYNVYLDDVEIIHFANPISYAKHDFGIGNKLKFYVSHDVISDVLYVCALTPNLKATSIIQYPY